MTHLLLLRPATAVVHAPTAPPRRLPAAPGPLRLVTREALLLGLLLALYQLSRLLGGRDVAAAFDHAGGILSLQQRIGLPSEQQLQSVVLSFDPVVQAANAYYAAAHVPVTFLALLWLLLSRPTVYRRARNALISATSVALAVYLLVPVAPPRMLPGFVDTAAVHGQSVYGDPSGSVLANQYAALPSLHVGWAVLVAMACVAASRSRWRWLWAAHPVVTVLVVVVTANHFWIDAIAGAVVVLVAWFMVAGMSRSGAMMSVACRCIWVGANVRSRVLERSLPFAPARGRRHHRLRVELGATDAASTQDDGTKISYTRGRVGAPAAASSVTRWVRAHLPLAVDRSAVSVSSLGARWTSAGASSTTKAASRRCAVLSPSPSHGQDDLAQQQEQPEEQHHFDDADALQHLLNVERRRLRGIGRLLRQPRTATMVTRVRGVPGSDDTSMVGLLRRQALPLLGMFGSLAVGIALVEVTKPSDPYPFIIFLLFGALPCLWFMVIGARRQGRWQQAVAASRGRRYPSRRVRYAAASLPLLALVAVRLAGAPAVVSLLALATGAVAGTLLVRRASGSDDS